MPKPRSTNSVDDIAKFVAAGHPQSAANCRVLLDEIEALRLGEKVQRNRAETLAQACEEKDQALMANQGSNDPMARQRVVEAMSLTLDGFENDPEVFADAAISAFIG